MVAVTQTDYDRKVDEIDRLLNDPDVPMQPSRVWSLLEEIARPPAPACEAGPPMP